MLQNQHIKDSHSTPNEYDNKYPEEKTQDRRLANSKMLGLVVITLTIIGGAAIVPFVHKIDVKSFYLKTIWRYAVIAVYFFPLAAYQIYQAGRKGALSTIFNATNGLNILKISFCQVLWTLSLIKGSELTLVSHAYLFNTLNGIILVIIKLCSGYLKFLILQRVPGKNGNHGLNYYSVRKRCSRIRYKRRKRRWYNFHFY